MVRRSRTTSVRLLGAAALLLTTAAAGEAAAQAMGTNSASFNAGWGRTPGDENRAVSAGTRDANGNRVIINGVIQGGSDQSFFSSGGASSAFAGAGAGGSTAIGNSLSVITQGNNNVVIVDSTQINNGDVSASGGSTGHGS